MGSTVEIGDNACNQIFSCMNMASSGEATVPNNNCNPPGFHACSGCSGTCGASDDSFITEMLGLNAGAKLRGTEDIDESEFYTIVCECGLTFDSEEPYDPTQAPVLAPTVLRQELFTSPALAPTSWRKMSRALRPRGCK
jgi:hypothetical protein